MTWNWQNFPSKPPKVGEEVQLAANGWEALLAFLAGPDWVYQVATIYPDVVQTKGADGRTGTDAWSEQDRLAVQESLIDYLRMAGIPDPPPDVEWRLVLPDGLTEERLWDSMNGAAAAAPPFGPSTAHAMVERLRVTVRKLLPARGSLNMKSSVPHRLSFVVARCCVGHLHLRSTEHLYDRSESSHQHPTQHMERGHSQLRRNFVGALRRSN